LAIHDRRALETCILIGGLNVKPKLSSEYSLPFIGALANRLDPACLMFLEKGVPKNINIPVQGIDSKLSRTIVLPSFFMLSIAFNSDAIFKQMMTVKCFFNLFS
jgi:hypothetical protein